MDSSIYGDNIFSAASEYEKGLDLLLGKSPSGKSLETQTLVQSIGYEILKVESEKGDYGIFDHSGGHSSIKSPSKNDSGEVSRYDIFDIALNYDNEWLKRESRSSDELSTKPIAPSVSYDHPDFISNKTCRPPSKHRRKFSGIVKSTSKSLKDSSSSKKHGMELADLIVTALPLVKGASNIRAKGLTPRVVISEHSLEVVDEDHLMTLTRNSARDVWLKTSSHISFKEFLAQQSNLKPVKYLDEFERKEYEVDIDDGRFMRNHKPFSTAEESTNWLGKGAGIFVVGPDKKFYVGSHIIGEFHHTSFLSGGAVISAGEVKSDAEGKILRISSKSGHYRPTKEQNLAVLSILRERGVDLSKVVFEECLPDGRVALHENALLYLENKGDHARATIFSAWSQTTAK